MTAASLKTLVTLLAKKPEKDKERMRCTFVEVSFESRPPSSYVRDITTGYLNSNRPFPCEICAKTPHFPNKAMWKTFLPKMSLNSLAREKNIILNTVISKASPSQNKDFANLRFIQKQSC